LQTKLFPTLRSEKSNQLGFRPAIERSGVIEQTIMYQSLNNIDSFAFFERTLLAG